MTKSDILILIERVEEALYKWQYAKNSILTTSIIVLLKEHLQECFSKEDMIDIVGDVLLGDNNYTQEDYEEHKAIFDNWLKERNSK